MFNNAKGGKVLIGNSEMYYAAFGNGEKNLVIILGLGDGLKSVKGQAITLASFYKEYANEYKVYVFGRKENLPSDYSIKEMASDQKTAMNLLGLKSACVMGVSLGGMIAQQMAIEFPEVIEKLVIGVSVSRPNDTVKKVVRDWIELAKNGNHKELIEDTMQKTYTPERYKKFKVWMPLITMFGKPKSFERFIIQAEACLEHNAYDELHRINCPTLIIGGDSDKVVGISSSEEMAEKIKGSKLIIYKGLGHGAYEETKDFNHQVMKFLEE
jgi:pimeloyl-ACP methyl ester carboxylesterase